MDTPLGIGLLVLAYLAGAFPAGVVLGRVFGGSDIRDFGSGSTGTTNALRVYGRKISAMVLTIDILKGAIPVVIAHLLDRGPWLVGAVAVLTVVGHCWSPFIEFDGGKGVATCAGALIALQPWVAFAIFLMIAIVLLTHYVSLGSIVTAITIGIGLSIAALSGHVAAPIAYAAILIAAIIVWRHKGNIHRLLDGTERRISLRGRATART
jgi:acyl phosphate:glycerol-3-phosphate acyltransferase